VAEPARSVQQATGPNVGVAFVDQGYTGDEAAEAAHDESRSCLTASNVRSVGINPA
jgi:hypothetical protein